MFCRMFRAKPLAESMLTFCQILRNNCNEIWILQCSLKIWNLNLKMVSAKSAAWRSFCLCHSMANETMVAWNVILEKSSNMKLYHALRYHCRAQCKTVSHHYPFVSLALFDIPMLLPWLQWPPASFPPESPDSSAVSSPNAKPAPVNFEFQPVAADPVSW